MNPFESQLALKNSCYMRPGLSANGEATLFDARTDEPSKNKLAVHVHGQLRALVLNPAFPCVFGRAALNKMAYRFGLYRDMTSAESISALAYDFCSFVEEQPFAEEFGKFSTFLVSFVSPMPPNELEFEKMLWNLLQVLHNMDVEHFKWDPATQRDPEDPKFSFSFAGRAYFLVGVNPHSQRLSRRFAYPTIAFNAHYQFEALREGGLFEGGQKTIRKKDVDLQGDINPNLADFGEMSEARQYSGRRVEAEWRCPFRPFTPELAASTALGTDETAEVVTE